MINNATAVAVLLLLGCAAATVAVAVLLLLLLLLTVTAVAVLLLLLLLLLLLMLLLRGPSGVIRLGSFDCGPVVRGDPCVPVVTVNRTAVCWSVVVLRPFDANI